MSIAIPIALVRPVQFGALPAAAEQLFTTPRSWPKNRTELRGSFLLLFFKEKPQNSSRTRGFSKLTRFRNTKKFSKPPFVDMDVVKTLSTPACVCFVR